MRYTYWCFSRYQEMSSKYGPSNRISTLLLQRLTAHIDDDESIRMHGLTFDDRCRARSQRRCSAAGRTQSAADARRCPANWPR